MMSACNWLKLSVLSILWGGSFVLVEGALEGFGPLTLVLIRVSLAAATLGTVAMARGQRFPRSLRVWGAYALMGLLANLLPFTLISWGQQQITAGMASMLNAAVPVFTVVIAHRFVADERLTGRRIAGVLIGFAGVSLLLLPGSGSGFLENNLGQLAVLLAAACYAGGAVYGKRLTAFPPVVNAASMLACSTLLLAPAALLFERPLSANPPAISWVAVIALAELSSALAYLLYFGILRTAGATHLSLVTFLMPIVTTLLGLVFLGERVTGMELLGLGVILFSLVTLDEGMCQRLLSMMKCDRMRSRPDRLVQSAWVHATSQSERSHPCGSCPQRGRCAGLCKTTRPPAPIHNTDVAGLLDQRRTTHVRASRPCTPGLG